MQFSRCIGNRVNFDASISESILNSIYSAGESSSTVRNTTLPVNKLPSILICSPALEPNTFYTTRVEMSTSSRGLSVLQDDVSPSAA